MRVAWRVLAIIGLCGLPSAIAEEIATDRPDFTESALVVPQGSWQFELGATRESAQAEDSRSGPEALIRWGLFDRIELRFELPNRIQTRNDSTTTGWGDAAVGVKWQIAHDHDAWDLALIASSNVPIGDAGLTSDRWDPSCALTASRELEQDWSLGAQLTVTAGAQDSDQLDGTLVLGHPLTRSANVGWFVELAASAVHSQPSRWLLHHGYAWRPRPNMQLDAHLAVGLSDAAPDWLIGCGFAWRLDKVQR
jgi:hypothetical protein